MTFDPRDPHREERLAERDRRYRESMQEIDTADDAHLAPEAIAACTLCDGDGYRPNGTVCDHQDRTAIARRGIEACRAALTKQPKT